MKNNSIVVFVYVLVVLPCCLVWTSDIGQIVQQKLDTEEHLATDKYKDNEATSGPRTVSVTATKLLKSATAAKTVSITTGTKNLLVTKTKLLSSEINSQLSKSVEVSLLLTENITKSGNEDIIIINNNPNNENTKSFLDNSIDISTNIDIDNIDNEIDTLCTSNPNSLSKDNSVNNVEISQEIEHSASKYISVNDHDIETVKILNAETAKTKPWGETVARDLKNMSGKVPYVGTGNKPTDSINSLKKSTNSKIKEVIIDKQFSESKEIPGENPIDGDNNKYKESQIKVEKNLEKNILENNNIDKINDLSNEKHDKDNILENNNIDKINDLYNEKHDKYNILENNNIDKINDLYNEKHDKDNILENNNIDKINDLYNEKHDKYNIIKEQVVQIVVKCDQNCDNRRIEILNLISTGQRLGYRTEVVRNDDEMLRFVNDKEDNIVIYLLNLTSFPQLPAVITRQIFISFNTNFLLPKSNVGLATTTSALEDYSKHLNTTSITTIIEQLHNDLSFNKVKAKIDNTNKLFLTLDQLSSVGNDGLNLMVDDNNNYIVHYVNNTPAVITAEPQCETAEVLVMALADYVFQSDDYMVNIKDETPPVEDVDRLQRIIMVGLFISKPQPFLQKILNSLSLHGLPPNRTVFYIYNQVEEHRKAVETFSNNLKATNAYKDVVLLQATSWASWRPLAGVKNMVLQECDKMKCYFYVHIDTSVYINPGSIPRVVKEARHGVVVAPILRLQQWVAANFWREMDSISKHPKLSWDHSDIIDKKYSLNMKNVWRASCVKTIYVLTHDLISQLAPRQPYKETNTNEDPDLAFCEHLRQINVPLIVSNSIGFIGHLINTTSYQIDQPDLSTILSNPSVWRDIYIDPKFWQILNGNLQSVRRPCHEVYEFPLFTTHFCEELTRIADVTGKWSTASKQDQRKRIPKEAVPTIDKYLSQLHLSETFKMIDLQLLQFIKHKAYPYLSAYTIQLGIVARFQHGELPGLQLHSDSSALSAMIPLTRDNKYQGGEIEFPYCAKSHKEAMIQVNKSRSIQSEFKTEDDNNINKNTDMENINTNEIDQSDDSKEIQLGCKFQVEIGHLLLHPGRLTHSKIYHNITRGTLHRLILHFDDDDM